MMKRKTLYLMALLLTGCIGQTQAQKTVFDWVTHLGDAGATITAGDVYENRSLAIDRQGNIYNVGDISSGKVAITLASGATTTLDADSGWQYIAKCNPNGDIIWIKQFGGSVKSCSATSVGVDSLGNIYIGGKFHGDFDLDPGQASNMVTSHGLQNIFLIKLDSLGNYIWGYPIGGSNFPIGGSSIWAMYVTPNGDSYSTGYYLGRSGDDIDFDHKSASNASTLSGTGGFVLKVNSSGDFQWVKGLEGAEGRSITLDDWGNILVTGDFSLRKDFNPGLSPEDTFFMTSYGNMDIFVVKLDPSGNFIWARHMGGKHQDQGFSITTDEAGSVYTTGIFADTADFDPGSNTYNMVSLESPNVATPNTTMEVFISKLDSAGNFAWARQTRGEGSNWGWSIDAGRGRGTGIYATGTFEKTADFVEHTNDTITLNSADGAFLIKIDTAGNWQWSKQLGADLCGTVLANDAGDIFTSGYFFKSPVDFDPGKDTFSVNKMGTRDGFILKLGWCNLSDTITQTSCKSFTYQGITYDTSGIYTVHNPEGCDPSSVTVLDLTIENPDPVINIDGFTLGTVDTYSTYQWLLNGNTISGATSRYYTVTTNGDYQVIVTNEHGCIDTSDIYTVNNAGIEDINTLARAIKVYPNPATEKVFIQSPVSVGTVLTDITGRWVKQVTDARQISLKDLSNGVYLLRISNQEGTLIKVEKIVKQTR